MNVNKLIVATGERSSDLRYATHFPTPDDYIYIETPTRRSAILSALEIGRAKSEVAAGVELICTEDFAGHTPEKIIIELADRLNVHEFGVPADFPLGLADALRRAGLTLNPAVGTLFPQREFKSAAEVAELRRAARVADGGMRVAIGMIEAAEVALDSALMLEGEPLTSERIRTAIAVEFLRNGAMAESIIVAGGVQGAQPHACGTGQLYAHTPIVMDLFPRLIDSGYWGDLTRTVTKGAAPDMVKRAFDAVLAAREAAKSKIRPGAIPAEIHLAAEESLAAAGFSTGIDGDGPYGFFHGLGHGLGLDIHEAPRLNRHNAVGFSGGEAVTVEPGVYYPQWGGMRLEDAVVVTADGIDCLTGIETVLELI